MKLGTWKSARGIFPSFLPRCPTFSCATKMSIEVAEEIIESSQQEGERLLLATTVSRLICTVPHKKFHSQPQMLSNTDEKCLFRILLLCSLARHDTTPT